MAQLAMIKQMSRQVSRGSAGHYQGDDQAGVEQLRWRLSGRRAGRWRAVQLAYIKQRAGRSRAAQLETIKQMSRKVSRGSGGDYQADEQAGVSQLCCRLPSR